MSADHMNRASVTILYGEQQSNLRSQMRTAVFNEGYQGLQDYSDFASIEAVVRTGWPDLVILDSELPGGDIPAFVEAVRHNELGENPFVPMIVTTWSADRPHIVRLVNSGVDDLLANPISPAQLLSRIEVLTYARKPFVVTSDYIGPDRREEADRDSNIPPIEVPNTMKDKMTGQPVDYNDVRESIDDVMMTINDERLKRHSYQISFLVQLILDSYASDEIDPRLPSHIERLSDIARDMGDRLLGSRYEHVGELCRSMIGTAGRIADQPSSPAAKDLELLKPLSDALIVGFNPEKESADMATEINAMLKNYAARSR